MLGLILAVLPVDCCAAAGVCSVSCHAIIAHSRFSIVLSQAHLCMPAFRSVYCRDQVMHTFYCRAIQVARSVAVPLMLRSQLLVPPSRLCAQFIDTPLRSRAQVIVAPARPRSLIQVALSRLRALFIVVPLMSPSQVIVAPSRPRSLIQVAPLRLRDV